jgi:hypothetical protein
VKARTNFTGTGKNMITEATRHQTDHHGEGLASADFTARVDSAKLVGGGVLTWNIVAGSGTLTWSQPLFIEFGTMPWRIRIAAGSKAGILAGSSLYVLLPFLSGPGAFADDVHPAGIWNYTVVNPYLMTTADVFPLLAPLRASGPDIMSKFFCIGKFAASDNTFILHNDCILSNGVPGAIAAGSVLGGSRVILTYGAMGTDWTNIGLAYAPRQRHLNLYVNGVLQLPARQDGAVASGYVAVADAHWQERPLGAGLPTDTLYGGITWIVAPSAGEVVTCELVSGSAGPPGPPGPAGGLDGAYNIDPSVVLSFGAAYQTPITLLEALDSFGAPPHYEVLASEPALGGFEILRSLLHPVVAARGKIASILDSEGNFGSSGIWLYNPYGYTTIQNEMEMDGPGYKNVMYFIGMEDNAGPTDAHDKLILACYPVELPFMDGNESNPEKLNLIRWLGYLRPDLIGTMGHNDDRGQVAINRWGEIASGWAKDFLHWYIFDFVFPFGSGSDVYDVTVALDMSVVTGYFMGGFATNPTEVSGHSNVFHHSNPSNAFVGDNPNELKLAVNVFTNNLEIRYGANLIGYTSHIVLFYSKEYEGGAP